ncbi:bifunctional phosphopantothenoylcysteine decarboxylase/phosphopantothenate--cysteine ligase CoaBC [Campylobacter insulaenigrae]|uniref:bifunctional phosphopantothenoylcysteine decarboxylase/phosphopantothenate--cysteine ligase CoaBC n=1 Tax=Campylobacter insulaenigrae TaxID=260714 RepID=UPI0021534FB0|nr:bifunctional phosphopantothenoylcysteine decarboxylase/phosphopantothenate--cysteine ligase CoaBC [Campylobacter insulaenigrae]MCR6570307.1 bifunctional phosphopantothenoylcysteine decarboxylase/phosphopantothenate--cysteine ligase CoaBC [Campylobacter insulaenigrae]MCR6571709.1 bifunctional phosphopantothenoylcysteine decarboxylase/phosphopantothenate--cysteine ligase CoaBC [Campylobacter insulaenigrae]MCR6573346.1 bifunctional phosphopantothenoylcysteine decarboxylase/phosphopantothenate--c
MKTVLLAISGSIAFYKAYELISLFKKEEFRVKVLLSKGVLNFASKMSFEALADEVLCEENESWNNFNNHIAFSKDCDVVVFAPASINSINKFSQGIADNLFIQTLIAVDKSKSFIIAPAANTNMYLHFSVQKSLKLLKENGYIIIDPIVKTLACKDEGIGALAEIKDIFNITKRELLKEKFWCTQNIIVTGGGTREKIDDVRCISNFSSGKMAKAIADACYFLGANVKLFSSINFDTPYELYEFESSKDLKELLNDNLENDFLVMVAAVSDFIPKIIKGKIKKEEYLEGLDLHLKLNEDLLKNCNFKGKKIGFKMEYDKICAVENAKKSLLDKNLDMICLNILDEDMEFGSDENRISFITKGQIFQSQKMSKEKLAFVLMQEMSKLQ